MENNDDVNNINNIHQYNSIRYDALIGSINCQHDRYFNLPTLHIEKWCCKTITDFIDNQTQYSEKRRFYMKDIVNIITFLDTNFFNTYATRNILFFKYVPLCKLTINSVADLNNGITIIDVGRYREILKNIPQSNYNSFWHTVLRWYYYYFG